jgi:hypothetical protein
MGYVFFHGVDAKIVGATGKSPLRYQNIHLTMMEDADEDADVGRGFSRIEDVFNKAVTLGHIVPPLRLRRRGAGG